MVCELFGESKDSAFLPNAVHSVIFDEPLRFAIEDFD